NQLKVEGPEGSTALTPASTEWLQSIARVLQTMLSKLGAAAPRAYAALPSEAVVIRYFQMPAIPAHERKMAIAFEAKKYLPFKLEELIYDYEVVIRRTDPTLMRVMFFGIKRSSIETYLSLFHAAGVSPICLEPAPLCLMRLIRHSGQLAAGQVAALLYVEHDSATISIARPDILYLSRNVSITPTEEGGEDPSPGLLEALVNETRVSIDYYRRRFLGEPPVQKILFFGKSVDPKKAAELSAALDLPVESADPFAKITGAQAAPPGLAVVAGLALRGMDRKQKEINLLPSEQRRQAEGVVFKPLIWEAAAAILALAVWYGFSMADLNRLQQRLSSLSSQIAWPKGVSPSAGLDDLRQLKNARDQETRLFKELRDPNLETSELFSALSKQMPAETWLQYLLYRHTYKPREPHRRYLRLIGNAFTGNRDAELELVNQTLAAFRKDPLFISAFKEFSLDSVGRARFEEEDVTEFLLTCATNLEDIRRDSDRSGRIKGRP
ncbi:MAG: pilus assembly protein PilM, partial [Candidatus Omnitrophica bacterium]|nr:pilus assembly protein PilM [Candidatus Omnitrophota bacterium]